MKSLALGLVIVAASAASGAQTAAAPARPDPLDARTAVPSSPYVSPFARYRPFAVQPPGPWREVNDQVGRIGGWKVYARESQESVSPAATGDAAGAGASKPSPGMPGPK